MQAVPLCLSVAVVVMTLLMKLPYDEHELSYGPFPHNTTSTPAAAPITAGAGLPYTRATVLLPSPEPGVQLEAWLYTPRGDTAAAAAADGGCDLWPVVIMAHGLGAQKDLGLHRFAAAFASHAPAPLAVLAFDYRTFGGSGGEPRHWASPSRHLADWRAVLAAVKGGALGPEYDTSRVALWGTSYAGGHVLVVAAEQPPGAVAAVVSMVPHLDGVEVAKANLRRRGVVGVLRLLVAGLHDRVGGVLAAALLRAVRAALPLLPGGHAEAAAAAFERSAGAQRLTRLASGAYVKLVGSREELALMQLGEHELVSYFAKHPAEKQGGWQPRVLARLSLESSSYRPIASLPRLTAPVLFVAATQDVLCPPHLVRAAAAAPPPPPAHAHTTAAAGNSTNGNGGSGGGHAVRRLLELNSTHFDVYHGEHLEAATAAMLQFLSEHLGASSTTSEEAAAAA